MTSQQQILPIEGVVKAVSKKDGEPSGIMLEEEDGKWWNLSQPQYRDKPYDIPEKGDRIAMGVQGGKWIKWIQVAPEDKPVVGNVFGNNVQTFSPTSTAFGTCDASIQKQVALKAAVELCIAAGVTSTQEILMAATKFNDWLIGDTHGNSPNQLRASDYDLPFE